MPRLATRHRIAAYALLSRAFLDGVRAEDCDGWRDVLHALLSDGSEAVAPGTDDGLRETGRRLREALVGVGPDWPGWEEARREHLRLFVGPYHVPAPPYESVYRSPQRLVMQEPAHAVRRAYAEAGVAVERLGEIPDDHLACELEFAGLLLAHAAVSGGPGAPDGRDAMERHRLFLTEHLLAWTPDLHRDIARAAPGGLYAAIAAFLVAFLRSEAGGRDSAAGAADPLPGGCPATEGPGS
ncbi:MAG: molecular chaperone TorD family protein [Candidatus Eisenbacteria bacterium]|nr:molecular chaperone TorD family protein [Candidatus Eisenbacteria bacterium]